MLTIHLLHAPMEGEQESTEDHYEELLRGNASRVDV
jgi:hypothetical protein